MGFPLTDPKKFPVSLGEVLSRMQEAGTLGHLSVSIYADGRCQASHKAPGSEGCNVYVMDDAWEAILRAIGPPYSKPWSSVVPGLEIDNEDDEDEDDYEDLL